jgi:ProP effector
MASPRKCEQRANAEALLVLLAKKWPRCFLLYEQRRRPLKVGIAADVLAALNGAVTPQELGAALRAYTGNRSYRWALQAGAPRVDLDGEPAGVVTVEEQEHARRRILAAALKRQRRAAPPPVKAKAEAQKAETPPRTSLEGLRAAALRRRAAS